MRRYSFGRIRRYLFLQMAKLPIPGHKRHFVLRMAGIKFPPPLGMRCFHRGRRTFRYALSGKHHHRKPYADHCRNDRSDPLLRSVHPRFPHRPGRCRRGCLYRSEYDRLQIGGYRRRSCRRGGFRRYQRYSCRRGVGRKSGSLRPETVTLNLCKR